MAEEVHVGDVGTIFRLTIMDGSSPVDLSGATTKNINFQKPDLTTMSKAGTFFTDGTDGIIQYTTSSDDLDLAGTWHIQASITLTAGQWKSEIQSFTVYPNIEVA